MLPYLDGRLVYLLHDGVLRAPVPRQAARNKEDLSKNRTGVPKRITRCELASTHNDTQARLELISGREHCEDTRKTSALGGVSFDSAISHICDPPLGISTRWTYHSEELALIKNVDRQPKSKTEPLLLSDGQTYASLYLGLLEKLQRVDTLQSILVLIADALTGMCHRICTFHRLLDPFCRS